MPDLRPPALKPPPRPRRSPEPSLPPRRRGGLAFGATVALFVVLGAAALAVFVALPKWVAPPAPGGGVEASALPAETSDLPAEASHLPAEAFPLPAEAPLTAPSASNPPPAERDLRAEAGARRAAQTLRGQVHDDRAAFADRGADRWGGEAWNRALARVAEADGAWDRADWTGAEGAYRTASEALAAVERRANGAQASALAEGQDALAAGDGAAAEAAFSSAAQIDPGDRRAAAGLARARVLDDVRSLLAQGADAEARGDLAGALDHFQQAAGLDPQSTDATRGAARVRARRADDAFGRALGEGYGALDRGDLAAAEDAFRRAGAQRAGDPQVAEAIQQLEAAKILEEIEARRASAAGHETAERWRRAEADYRVVLALDASVAFARRGLERAIERAEWVEGVEHHLAHPQRLASEDVLMEASRLLDRGRAMDAEGPEHRRLADALEGRIAAYSTTVRGVVESDGQTDVVVYKVGRLGKVERRTLDLRPGTYVVVGSRPGYRDVRREWVIEPGVEPAPLQIRCEETLR